MPSIMQRMIEGMLVIPYQLRGSEGPRHSRGG